MTTTNGYGARRRIRLTAVPLAVVFALSGLAACGSDDGDGEDNADGGRVTVVLGATEAATPEQLAQARQILERRLELAGVEKDTVKVEGDRIVVSAPGRFREILDGIGESGRMEFRTVLVATQVAKGAGASPSPSAPAGPATSGPAPSGPAPSAPGRAPDVASGGYVPRATPPPVPTGVPNEPGGSAGDLAKYGVTPEMTAAFDALDCVDAATAERTAVAAATSDPNTPLLACAKQGPDGLTERFILGTSSIDGADLAEATAQPPEDGQPGGWQVSLKFDASGADKFRRITGDLAASKYPTNRFAAVVDGRVVVAPTVMEELPGGIAVITGSFTQADAKRLAALLRGGSLPVHLTVVSTTGR